MERECCLAVTHGALGRFKSQIATCDFVSMLPKAHDRRAGLAAPHEMAHHFRPSLPFNDVTGEISPFAQIVVSNYPSSELGAAIGVRRWVPSSRPMVNKGGLAT